MGVGYNPKIVTSNLVFAMDAANKKSFSPNTFPNPKDITTWWITLNGSGNGNNCNVAQDLTITSPAGGIPMKMNVNGNDAHISSWNASKYNISRANNGETWRVSVYAKAAANTDGEIYIFGANSGGIGFVNSNFIGITSKAINITTEWQRFDHSITFANSQIQFIQARLDGTQANGSGNTIWWDGWQVERSTALSDFNEIVNSNNNTVIDLTGRNAAPNLINVIYDTANNKSFNLSNATSTYISFSDVAAANITNNITIDTWVNVEIFNNLGGIITYGSDAYEQYALWTSSSSNRVVFSTNWPTDWKQAYSNTLQTNTWYNIVTTFTGGSWNIFVNGVSNTSGTFANTSAFPVGANPTLSFGINHPGGDEYFRGKLGAAKIYDRVLTAEEIAQNFNASRRRYGI